MADEVRMIRPRHRSLPEIRARAKAELNRNPTISVYGWRDGREWNRRRAEPWASFRQSLEKLGQAFFRITPVVEGFREDLQRALAALPAPQMPRPGLPVPGKPPRGLSVVPRLSEEHPKLRPEVPPDE